MLPEETQRSAERTTELEVWNIIAIKGLHGAVRECQNKLKSVIESLSKNIDDDKRAYYNGMANCYTEFIHRHTRAKD